VKAIMDGRGPRGGHGNVLYVGAVGLLKPAGSVTLKAIGLIS